MGHSVICFGCASIALLAATILAHVSVTAPRRNLGRFLSEVATVQMGKTKMEDWRQRLGQARLSNLTFGCEQQNCSVGLREENKLLHMLRLAPPTIAEASVAFKNGMASGIYVIVAIETRDKNGEWHDDKGVVVRLDASPPGACHPHYNRLSKYRSGIGDEYWVTVGMDSYVSPDDRAKALAINSFCLTRISGCPDVEAMIPQVFAHN
jgi:hypothetical protein